MTVAAIMRSVDYTCIYIYMTVAMEAGCRKFTFNVNSLPETYVFPTGSERSKYLRFKDLQS